MKRQDAFDRMRANRGNAQHRAQVRIVAELQEQARADDAQYAANRARTEALIGRINLLGHAGAIPFMPDEYYDDIKQQMDRLANEHGIHAGKPRREFKVVGK